MTLFIFPRILVYGLFAIGIFWWPILETAKEDAQQMADELFMIEIKNRK